jgi:hypothetical protein
MLHRLLYAVRVVALISFAALPLAAATAQSNDTLTAFSNFIKAGNYENANFYLSNNLLDPKLVDTSQLFYDALMERHWNGLPASLGQIDTLYQYLNALGPIDLNRVYRCHYDQDRTCLLATHALSGTDRNTVTFFVDRGLDLNLRIENHPPSTIPLLVRLGDVYSLEDLNYFVSKGLVLGDELYTINELASYEDSFLYNNDLNLPQNYLELRDQNLLDVLVMALGTSTDARAPQESLHQAKLCEFISYAAPSFSPSFDYLLYILHAVDQFRGGMIGQMERYSDNVYQPFPTACVSLIQQMAISHSKLESVISNFAGQGDVDTANWLISIKTGQN